MSLSSCHTPKTRLAELMETLVESARPRGGLARTWRVTAKGLCELEPGPSRQRGLLPIHSGHNGATASASSVPRGLCPAPALQPRVQPRP